MDEEKMYINVVSKSVSNRIGLTAYLYTHYVYQNFYVYTTFQQVNKYILGNEIWACPSCGKKYK